MTMTFSSLHVLVDVIVNDDSFTARQHTAVAKQSYRSAEPPIVEMCSSVCPSVCLSYTGLTKRLYGTMQYGPIKTSY